MLCELRVTRFGGTYPPGFKVYQHTGVRISMYIYIKIDDIIISVVGDVFV